jgi:hypothetical protein
MHEVGIASLFYRVSMKTCKHYDNVVRTFSSNVPFQLLHNLSLVIAQRMVMPKEIFDPGNLLRERLVIVHFSYAMCKPIRSFFLVAGSLTLLVALDPWILCTNT